MRRGKQPQRPEGEPPGPTALVQLPPPATVQVTTVAAPQAVGIVQANSVGNSIAWRVLVDGGQWLDVRLDGEGRFACPLCPAGPFANVPLLDVHVQANHKTAARASDSNYRIHLRNVSFPHGTRTIDARTLRTEQGRYRCPFCSNEPYDLIDTLRAHIVNKHDQSPVSADAAAPEETQRDGRSRPAMIRFPAENPPQTMTAVPASSLRSADGRYRCPVCSADQYVTVASLRSHISWKHSRGTSDMPTRPRAPAHTRRMYLKFITFADGTTMADATSMQDDQGRFLCPFCSHVPFVNFEQLRLHVKLKHDLEPQADAQANAATGAVATTQAQPRVHTYVPWLRLKHVTFSDGRQLMDVPMNADGFYMCPLCDHPPYKLINTLRQHISQTHDLPPNQDANDGEDDEDEDSRWTVYLGDKSQLRADDRLEELGLAFNEVSNALCCLDCGVEMSRFRWRIHLEQQHARSATDAQAMYVNEMLHIASESPYVAPPPRMALQGIRSCAAWRCPMCSFVTASKQRKSRHQHGEAFEWALVMAQQRTTTTPNVEVDLPISAAAVEQLTKRKRRRRRTMDNSGDEGLDTHTGGKRLAVETVVEDALAGSRSHA